MNNNEGLSISEVKFDSGINIEKDLESAYKAIRKSSR